MLPVPNVDVESEDEFEDDTDEVENDDSRPPMIGNESRLRWSVGAPDAEAVGSLLMLRATSLVGLVIGLDGLDPLSLGGIDDACWVLGDRDNRLKISHLLLLLPLTALLVLGLLLDLQLVLLLLWALKLKIALVDIRRSLLAAVVTAVSTAEADFLIGDFDVMLGGFTGASGAEVTDDRLPLGEHWPP